MTSEPALDAATAAELRAVVSEVLAEILPGLARPPAASTGASLPRRLAPAPVLAAGGVPSGLPAGVPAAPPPAGPGHAIPGAGRAATARTIPGAGRTAARTTPGAGRTATARTTPRPMPADGAGESWTVSLDSDDDLDTFVRRVLKLADNPKSRQDLIAGRVRFRLAGRPGGATTKPVHRVDRGAVTERAVAEAARIGARLVLGRRAVLTPLARDKARALGVPIEKER